MASPCSAFRVFPLVRTCQELCGSDATLMFRLGSVKKLNDVPQGQNSTSASGLMLRAVS